MQERPTVATTRMHQRGSARVALVLLVLLAELAHLGWEHTHGGIASHHLLNRADLPAIWNGWGLLVLPALAWWLGGRTQRRVGRRVDGRKAVAGAFAGFVIALGLGAALSVAFLQGQEGVAATLFFSMFALALLLPAYRAECVLGFVLAMTFTFGAVLPTLIAGVLAAISALAHLALYPRVARAWRAVRASRGPRAEPVA